MNAAMPSLSCTARVSRAGVGLKPVHYRTILETSPALGFLEVHAENYMGDGGPPHRYLAAIRERYPLSLHGVGLSIGAEGPLARDHLGRLKALVDRYQPALVSEHLAWSSHDRGFLNDLLPLPYTSATLRRVVDHVTEVQDTLGRQILLENPATYLAFAESRLSEPDFIAEVARRSGCALLLDLNNVVVAATNQHWDPIAYLDAFALAEVREIHLAGHLEEVDEHGRPLLIDTHDRAVAHRVWQLYRHALERIGPTPTLVEWDSQLPTWSVLLAEATKAEQLMRELPTEREVQEQGETPRQTQTQTQTQRQRQRQRQRQTLTLTLTQWPLPWQQTPAQRSITAQAAAPAPHLAEAACQGAAPVMASPSRQQAFASALLDPTRALPPGLVGPDGGPAVARFNVYRNNVVSGLIGTLRDAYPAVARIVGDAFFTAMAACFVRHHLPGSPLMLAYGADFPAFIGRFEPASSGLPWLQDVARLERAWLEAHHAAEAKALSASAFAGMTADELMQLGFALHPALRLVRSRYPVLTLWQTNIAGGEPTWIDLDAGGQAVLVNRANAEVLLRALPAGGATFVEALSAGRSARQALTLALRDDAGFDLAGNLAGLIDSGALVAWHPLSCRRAA